MSEDQDILTEHIPAGLDDEDVNVSDDFICSSVDDEDSPFAEADFSGEEFDHLTEEEKEKFRQQFGKLQTTTGKNILKGLDFIYMKQCATCQLAFKDPEIHETYRRTNNVQKVLVFLEKKYKEKAPSAKSVYRHINQHFKPREEISKKHRADFQKEIANQISDVKGTSTPNQLLNLKSILWRGIVQASMINVSESDLKAHCDVQRTIGMLSKTYIDAVKMEMSIAGMDVTPEEMRNRVKSYVENWIQAISDNEDQHEAQKLIDIFMRNRPTEGL